MEIIPVIIVSRVMLTLAGGYLWSAAWAVGDAQGRGRGGGFIVPLFCIFGPLAALLWLMVRPKQLLIDIAPRDYSNPDDALAAASRLDSLGDWDAAIVIYQSVATRWPENATYCQNSIAAIERKKRSS